MNDILTFGAGAPDSAPKNIFAEFFTEPVHMTFLSEKEGRPIYEDREHIRVLIAGDSKTVVVRVATEEDKVRFSEQYKAFKAKGDQLRVGTPLEQWGAMPGSQVRMFNAANVFTVEQLAEVDDNAISQLGTGGREWRAKAQAFIETSKNNSHAQHLAAELERRDQDIGALQKQVEELSALLEDTSKKKASK